MKVTLLNFLVITLLCPVMLYGADDYSAQKRGSAQTQGKVTKIVIDPGHGGKDPGTLFGKTYEKDIVLNIAKELGALIKKNLPDVEVIYTRTTDKYLQLHERSDIANKAGADLFLSIHINAIENKPDVNGTSTFVMGYDKSGANLEVAMKENEVIKYEPNFETTYDGFRADDPSSYIIFQLQQFANQDQSMILAETVQKHFRKDLPMVDRGAYHGSFLVLWRTAMPSVLTEIGFMTNRKDREYMATGKGQTEAARSLFNAFSEYKSRIEGRSTMVQLKTETPAATPPIPAQPDKSSTQQTAQTTPPTTAKETTAAQEKPKETAQSKGEYSSTSQRARTTLPDISAHFKAEEEKASATNQVINAAEKQAAGQQNAGNAAQSGNTVQATERGTPTGQALRPASSAAPQSRIVYYVQVSALASPKSVDSPDFKSYRGKVVERRVQTGSYRYKYLVGGFASYEEASRALSQVRRDFPDAFMVAFDGDEQITPAQARQRQ